MLASTTNADYVSLRASKRDLSVSPSLHYRTPPRVNRTMTYGSPMLTPSPLKRHAPPSAEPMDTDDIFQSPAVSSSNTRRPHSQIQVPTDEEFDEDEGFLLAPSSSSFSRSLFTTASPLPPQTLLRTPVKQSRRTPDRPVLSVKPINTPWTMTPGRAAGTKRKPTAVCTPLRKRTLTPLNVTSGTCKQDDPDGMAFDRLAPLSAPRFVLRTPQTRAETEMHLKRQAETMTMLKISDLAQSGDESGYDSGPEVRREGDEGRRLFLGGMRSPFSSVKKKTKAAKGKAPVANAPGLETFIRRGQANQEEVAEAVSPGGHVTKRRARSRPVSSELLESVQGTLAVAEDEPQDKGTLGIYSTEGASSVTFPSHIRSRTLSSSSSETGSPITRNRLISGTMPRIRTQSHSQARVPLNRLTSTSSATLFFGPSIPTPGAMPRSAHNAGATTRASVAKSHDFNATSSAQPQMTARHNHPSPHKCPSSWAQRDSNTLSPYSSPTRKRPDDDDEEADLFFNGPPDTSFAFSVTEGTPSPKKKQRREAPSPLPKKFKPRDSGIALDSSDDEWALPRTGGGLMPALPRASTSVSTMGSDGDDRALVTPVYPTAASGWPGVVSLDDDELGPGMGRSVDAFIMRALAAGAAASALGDSDGEPKRVPGTPVKKVKTAHLVGGVNRPWQSAVAHKIGFPEFDEDPRVGGGAKGKGKGKGRKSLPAAFPGLGKENRGTGKDKIRAEVLAAEGGDTDVEDEDASPSTRRDTRYDGLGLGRPAAALPGFARPGGKTHWLMRRSSSGAFSSSSEASTAQVVTPTRNPKDWHLPPPRVPTQASPLKNSFGFSEKRSASGSSSSTSTATNSPTTAAASRHLSNGTPALQRTPTRPHPGGLFGGLMRPHTQAHAPARGRPSFGSGEEQPGRFEREFEEIDELGRGQFGRAMKVRRKHAGAGEEVYAVKKCKQFEGVKHRLRLREEVDILQHLAQAAGRERHPNVLAYIDSWEEDETLYIRTELCAFGNFAHFLWTYGRAFPRLDEARVWRVLAELSAGLRFIHDAGVLHLDLKPANIFVTDTGRLRIGDFGMAARWPRSDPTVGGFEREGDKRYLAPEVLQGRYGKAADMFSLGLTMLETATNIVVPDQGDAWHRLRREDFSQVQSELDTLSSSMRDLLWWMMRMEPGARADVARVDGHVVVRRVRAAMERGRLRMGDGVRASALGVVPEDFLDDVLDEEWEMYGMDTGL